ncbi:MAG: hypothetical protein V8T24_07900 [Roseburia hominis]
MEDEHVGLVIKMNNPKQEDLEVLREQRKSYQNVYLIAEVLDKTQSQQPDCGGGCVRVAAPRGRLSGW